MHNEVSLPQSSAFLESVRVAIRSKNYSIKTEHTYLGWIRRFIYFHDKRHPKQMGSCEVEAFLTHLAVNHEVAPATQRTALNALVFVYREVLKQPIGG